MHVESSKVLEIGSRVLQTQTFARAENPVSGLKECGDITTEIAQRIGVHINLEDAGTADSRQ